MTVQMHGTIVAEIDSAENRKTLKIGKEKAIIKLFSGS